MADADPCDATAEEEQEQQQQRDNGEAGADADADAGQLQRADTRARLESSCSSPGAPDGAEGRTDDNGRGDDGGGERRGAGSPGEKRPRAGVMEDDDDEDEVTSGSRAMGGRPGNEGACSSSGASGSAAGPHAALESLPSRRAQTVPAQAKYEPSRTAQERAKLKKVYSFVNVDTINLQMGAVPVPSRCATGAGAEGDPESAGGRPRPHAQSAGADYAGASGGASSELSSDDEGGPNGLPASARRPRDGLSSPELNNGSASPSDSSSAPSTPKDERGRAGSGDRTKR